MELHPSPETVLPSSHCSPGSMTPSPHSEAPPDPLLLVTNVEELPPWPPAPPVAVPPVPEPPVPVPPVPAEAPPVAIVLPLFEPLPQAATTHTQSAVATAKT